MDAIRTSTWNIPYKIDSVTLVPLARVGTNLAAPALSKLRATGKPKKRDCQIES
jgi:hypothetical protein